jgi:hypothetical protein
VEHDASFYYDPRTITGDGRKNEEVIGLAFESMMTGI